MTRAPINEAYDNRVIDNRRTVEKLINLIKNNVEALHYESLIIKR